MPAEPDKETEAPDEADATFRPTHRLKDIKAGDKSVQLLVSTKDHVYEAENVEVGIDAWQVIGAWEEASLPELWKCLSSRQTIAMQGGTNNTAFGSRYGAGKSLSNGVRP